MSEGASEVREVGATYSAGRRAEGGTVDRDGRREDDVPEGYKRTEVGVIPEDWEVIPVGDTGDVTAGKALAVDAPGSLRPYLRTKNVFDGRIDIEDVLKMPMTDAEFERFRLRYGDVLLNEGQTLELIGRCSIYRDEYTEPCAIQNQLIRYRSNDMTSAEFASHLFRMCQKSGVFAKIALQTTSVAHLGATRFQKLKLAWPPLSEQRAIAEALSDADRLIESLDKLIAKKRAAKQAAMQQLLTGKTRLPGFSGEWETKRLGEVAEMHRVSTVPAERPDTWVLHYSIPAYDFDAQPVYEPGENILSSKFEVPHGAILISKLNPRILRIWKADFYTGLAVTSTEFMVITPKMKVSRDFLYWLSWSPLFHAQMLSSVTGTTGSHQRIHPSTAVKLHVQLPSNKSEQTAIATVLSDMDAEIAALEKRRDKAKAVKQGMMQELLTGRIRLVEPETRTPE